MKEISLQVTLNIGSNQETETQTDPLSLPLHFSILFSLFLYIFTFRKQFKAIIIKFKEGISQEKSKKMVLESYTYDNFQYLYINQIKDFKSSLLEIVGKISFSDFYMHLMMNIQKLYNIKEIHELTAKQIIIIKNNHNKLKIQNNKLRTENSGLKIKIQTLKTENIGLKDQNFRGYCLLYILKKKAEIIANFVQGTFKIVYFQKMSLVIINHILHFSETQFKTGVPKNKNKGSCLIVKEERIIHENSKKISSQLRADFNFRYFYIEQIKNLKYTVFELMKKLSFSEFQQNLLNNLLKFNNIKEIQGINSNQMINLKNEKNKLKIKSENLAAENLELKIKIKTLKDNLGYKELNIYFIVQRATDLGKQLYIYIYIYL